MIIENENVSIGQCQRGGIRVQRVVFQRFGIDREYIGGIDGNRLSFLLGGHFVFLVRIFLVAPIVKQLFAMRGQMRR